jgi:phosphoserine phosphatase
MSFDVVCFDFDSTLSKIEGIDELARRKGLFAEVSALTDAAMNGELALEDVYAKRLELIKPSAADLDWLGDLYIQEKVAGVSETIKAIQDQQIKVHIISGGLRQAILPLARYLVIPDECVHAVEVIFQENGEYADFVRYSPLAVSGGKARVCRKIRMTLSNMAMVGDGKTDLEAKLAGAYMVGFGGVVPREIIKQQADCYITDANLQAVLPYLIF